MKIRNWLIAFLAVLLPILAQAQGTPPGIVTTNQLGAANGVAPLDGTAKVPTANLPAVTAQGGLAAANNLSDVANASTARVNLGAAPLASPTFTGTVTIPTGASIAGYAPLVSPTFTGTPTVPGYAPLASPTFTGTPVVPGYLTTGTAASTYAPLASPTFTGTPTVPGYLTTGTAASTFATQTNPLGTLSGLVAATSGAQRAATGADIAASGGLSAAAPNFTGPLSYNGQPILQANTGSAGTWLFGPFSGASLAANSQFITTHGAYVFESLQGYPLIQESTGMGMGAGIAVTTGSAITAFGTGCASAETNAVGVDCFGDTTMRNVWDTGGDTVVGTGSLSDGVFGSSTNAAESIFGQQSLVGSAATMTVTGTPHAGDTLPFTFTTANACTGAQVNCTTGAPITLTYTVQSSDTTANALAASLATFLSNNNPINYRLGDGVLESSHNLYGLAWQIYDPTFHPNVLKGHFPGSWQITTTAGACTGTCAETVVVGPGLTGTKNTLTGHNILGYFGATTAQQNAIHGSYSFSRDCVTCSFNSTNGISIAPAAVSAIFNAGSGYSALAGCTSCQQNVFNGAYAGYTITTGQQNTIDGDETTAGSACITTGNNNYEAGAGACVQSPTASYQMSIQNILYGIGNSGTGSTVSTGSLGVGQVSPGARFDILGTGTGAELAFRVTSSTGTVLLSLADNGTLWVGAATGASCSGTPTSSFASVNGFITHC